MFVFNSPSPRYVFALLLACALALSGCSENADWKRGKELLAAGSYPEAAEALRAALKSEPDNSEIRIDLAKSLAAFINGKTYGEFEELIGQIRAAGKESEAATLEDEAAVVGKMPFAQGDYGLAGLGVKLYNAGDKSLELPVLWALRYEPDLIKAYYPKLEMEGKSERFAGEIKWSADDVKGAEAALALYEIDRHPAIADQLQTKLNFMLSSDFPDSVALADKALQSDLFEQEKVGVMFNSAHLNGKPGSAARKAGFEYRLKHDNMLVLVGFLANSISGVVFRPEESCSAATQQAAGELATALAAETAKEALSINADSLRNLTAKGMEAATSGPAGDVPVEDCLKTWEALKAVLAE